MKYGHFDAKEFACKDGSESPWGPMNVREELLVLLERIRNEFGKPIVVNSGWRSANYNRAVGGVENSYHVLGLAADIRPQDSNDLMELQRIALTVNFEGGVGLYDTFVHVDARGKKARWDNRTGGD